MALTLLNLNTLLTPARKPLDDDAVSISSDWTIDQAFLQDDACVIGSPLKRMSYFNESGSVDSFQDEDQPFEGFEDDEEQETLAGSVSTSSGSRQATLSDDYSGMLDSLQLANPDSLRVQRISADSTSLPLALFLNSEPYRSDPRNHAVHTEIVEHGTDAFLVTKKLYSWQQKDSDLLRLSTVGDALELVRQILEGLAFFHANSIARVPMSPDNVRMDIGLAPTDVPLDRGEFPVRYYFMDLNTAGCFERIGGVWRDILRTDDDDDELELAEVAEEDEELPLSPIELEYDPYVEDIYELGTMLETTFKSLPGNPLRTLTASMTQREPSYRPSAESALESFEILWDSMDPVHLDAPVSL